MNRLVSQARGQSPPLQSKLNQKFNVDISGSSGKLRQSLGKAAEAVPALEPAANKAVDISIDLRAKPRRIHQVIKTTDSLSRILPMITLAGILTALAFSAFRRRTLITAATALIVLMLVELIAVKLLRQSTLDQVKNPANLSAVSYIFDSSVAWLREMVYIALGGLVILIVILLASGPTNLAKSLRVKLRLTKIPPSRAIMRWQSLRLWIKNYEYYLWLATLILVLITVTTFNKVTGQVAINAALLAISLFALLHIVATPPSRVKKPTDI